MDLDRPLRYWLGLGIMDNIWDEDFDDALMVCTTHKRFVPCRRGHVDGEWGVGCEFSKEPHAVMIVAFYQSYNNIAD